MTKAAFWTKAKSLVSFIKLPCQPKALDLVTPLLLENKFALDLAYDHLLSSQLCKRHWLPKDFDITFCVYYKNTTRHAHCHVTAYACSLGAA